MKWNSTQQRPPTMQNPIQLSLAALARSARSSGMFRTTPEFSYDAFAFDVEAKSINSFLYKGNTTNASAEIRLEAFDGPLLATIPVADTGSFLNFETFSANFNTTITIIHDLYVVCKGGAGFLMHLECFTVNSITSASPATLTATASSTDGALIASNAVDGYRKHNTDYEIHTSNDGVNFS